MKNEKILAFALAAAMALPLTACGNTAASASTASVSAASAAVSSAEAAVSVSTADSAADTVAADSAAASTAAAAAAQTLSLSDLYAQGYAMGSSSYSDGILSVHYTSADHTDFELAECAMSEDQCDEFFNIDFFAEDYDRQCMDYLSGFPDLTIRCINDMLPDPSEYQQYVGQTIEELMNAGLDFAGYADDDDGKLAMNFYVYTESGNDYTIHVYPEGEPQDDSSYNDETILPLVVGRIVFWDYA